MDSIWFTRRMQEPMKNPDCNNCKWLNLTEEEQRQQASQGLSVIFIPHVCEKYNKRVIYRRNDNIVHHLSFIWPCDDCRKDSYEHYIERR